MVGGVCHDPYLVKQKGVGEIAQLNPAMFNKRITSSFRRMVIVYRGDSVYIDDEPFVFQYDSSMYDWSTSWEKTAAVRKSVERMICPRVAK